ncbi:hypothetical protein [Parvibaculum sp.]|uniref:hypothetical protein n=1 Tax=Parvibaculum sp. TaxID=2024848 RepID=UPI003BAD0D54
MRRAYLYFIPGAIFLVPALLLCVPGIAHAQGEPDARVMSEGEYKEALAFLKGTGQAMAEADAALGNEAAPGEAEARKADLGQRLDMLRRLMTAAAQRDRIGAGGPRNNRVTPERKRARDVIEQAGAIEDRLQDLWVMWSQRARRLQAP